MRFPVKMCSFASIRSIILSPWDAQRLSWLIQSLRNKAQGFVSRPCFWIYRKCCWYSQPNPFALDFPRQYAEKMRVLWTGGPSTDNCPTTKTSPVCSRISPVFQHLTNTHHASTSLLVFCWRIWLSSYDSTYMRKCTVGTYIYSYFEIIDFFHSHTLVFSCRNATKYRYDFTQNIVQYVWHRK